MPADPPATTSSATPAPEVTPTLNVRTTALPASTPTTVSSAAPSGVDEADDKKMALTRLELRDPEGGHVAFVEIPVRDTAARVIRWKRRLFIMEQRNNQYREVTMADAQDADD